jgi:hypothetical protein
MQSDNKAPYSTTQIARGYQPTLRKTYRIGDFDGSQSQPFDVQQESKRLLNIRPEKVEYQNDELVTSLRP